MGSQKPIGVKSALTECHFVKKCSALWVDGHKKYTWLDVFKEILYFKGAKTFHRNRLLN